MRGEQFCIGQARHSGIVEEVKKEVTTLTASWNLPHLRGTFGVLVAEISFIKHSDHFLNDDTDGMRDGLG